MIYHQIISPVLSPTGIKNVLSLEANPVSSYEEWRELIHSNHELNEVWLWMFNLYEMAGIYLREGVADLEFYSLHQPYWNLRFWRQAKTIIYKHRERFGPSYFRNMECLFDSLEKYFKEHPELAS